MANVSALTRSVPEAEGMPFSAVLNFVQAIEDHEHPLDALHGFMLLRHGKVVAEGWWSPYSPSSPHALYSLSKSFTSTGIGFAVGEGLLQVDDPVLAFFPEEAPANPGEHLKAMRVRHLLTMNTGHKEDTTRRVFHGEDDNWARAFLSLPIEHEPGSWFVYNTAATYMLSAIVSKLTGETLLDYLRPRLLNPLGIDGARWETDPRGISVGGSGLHATTEDIARFGQLYLQNGVWAGKRIVPEGWIAEATSAHSDNSNTQSNPDWTVGYGYQFWRNRAAGFRGDGAFGQYCIVLPGENAVLAINGGVRNMQGILDLVWKHLLPAMQPGDLPCNQRAHDQLLVKLASLTLPLPERRSPPTGVRTGTTKIYTLDQNELGLERIAITFGDDRDTILIADANGSHPLELGHATWHRGTSRVLRRDEQPVAASGGWTGESVYEARICFYETEFCPIARLCFEAGDLRLEIDPNVAWGSPSVTTISGRPAK